MLIAENILKRQLCNTLMTIRTERSHRDVFRVLPKFLLNKIANVWKCCKNFNFRIPESLNMNVFAYIRTHIYIYTHIYVYIFIYISIPSMKQKRTRYRFVITMQNYLQDIIIIRINKYVCNLHTCKSVCVREWFT